MAKRGPKLTPINWVEFDKLCVMQCSLIEIASWFECSPDTIERSVLREKKIKFADYFEQKRGKGKIALRRKMFDMAQNGNVTLLIWLSKQYLDMKDKVDQNITQTTTDIPATPDQLKAARDKFAIEF